jgi:hypothetical protein
MKKDNSEFYDNLGCAVIIISIPVAFGLFFLLFAIASRIAGPNLCP